MPDRWRLAPWGVKFLKEKNGFAGFPKQASRISRIVGP